VDGDDPNMILVTGGAGYIGSRLVLELLENDYQVRVFDASSLSKDMYQLVRGNSNFEFVKGDVGDIDAITQSLKDIDVVVHLAALVPGPGTSYDAKTMLRVNFELSRQLVELCKNKDKIEKFIFTSTCGNYGISDTTKYVTESEPLNPTSPYAEAKVKAEEYFLNSAEESFHPTVLRLATVFGPSPKMSWESMVNTFVLEAFNKRSIIIYGAQSWRPLVHIDDVAQAILHVLRAPLNLVFRQVFNVGSLNCQKIQIINVIKEAFPQAVIEIKSDAADPRSYKVSFDKISRALGFQATKGLEEGIKEMKELLEGKYR